MEVTITKADNTITVTKRDIEIVEGLKNDLTVRSIAANLGKSPRTVELQVKNLKSKVGSKTLHGLLYLFIKNGLLD